MDDLKLGLIPRNLKTFILSINCHFLEKITKIITRVICSIFTTFLFMIFKIFHENSYYRNSLFGKSRENHLWDEFIKIREFTQVIIFVIFLQK